ncbi:MAG: 30S ribosomal protein S16 [Prolixibacteraceae bacterium]|jgi:small subunit ribosomal protein S16|nr:30S ribosomal protein S16 [Prolixibacteraceae bacterium]
MPVKIRLARHGRKKFAFYHIVVADSRAPRDGKYIERIGLYNPNTNPATIELDFDKALGWLNNGAQPTDTTRAILSYRGVMMKKHLQEGVRKGAFDEAEAERRFETWLTEKEAKIQTKIEKLASDASSDAEKRLAAEAKVNEARAAELAKRKSDLAAEAQAASNKANEASSEATSEEAPEAAVEETKTEEVATEAPVEEVATEAPVEEATTEAPVEEATTEAPAEEATTEAPAEEATTEAPAEEKATETPAEEKAEEEKKDTEA